MEKTIKTMLALMAGALTFSACSSDEFATNENQNNGAKLVTLTAYQEGDDATSRAAIGTTTSGSTPINWTDNDAIGVFASTGNPTQYTTTTGGSTSASFTGTPVTGAAYALYPYQSTATCASGVITAEVPMTQYAVENSFDPKAALMVGSVSSGSVQFHNVMSFVKVTVPEGMTQCKQITIKAKDEWITLAGKVKITVADEPTWAETDDKEGQAFVRLVPQSGSTYLTANKTYYIAVLPQTMTSGFEIIYNVNDDIYCKQTTKSDVATKNFYRNKTKNIGSLSTANTYYTYKVTAATTLTNPSGATYSTLKMADRNIGAAETTAYGDYFAWGALRPMYTKKPSSGTTFTDLYKDGGFSWANAPYYTGDGTNHSWGKYTSAGSTLDASDDIAAMLWGGNWRMPTEEEWTANKSNTSVKGLLLAGCCHGTTLDIGGFYSCYYWSSTVGFNNNAPDMSRYLFFNGNTTAVSLGERGTGYSVRPVLAQ